MHSIKLAGLSEDAKQYLIVTGNYWAFTLTDGALRMLIVLHFYQLGYSPLQLALLFVFYEVFGVLTNLSGGWLGARLGLNRTMNLGLCFQILALAMLLVPQNQLSVLWIMIAQALSGIAKDLNKMSAKSSIKLLVPRGAQGQLYQWVAVLTGSKNALKGVGFFMGGALLSALGFRGAVWVMAAVLCAVWLLSLINLRKELGKTRQKPKFQQVFSKSKAINTLSAARLFLFASRDVWFAVALPVYLTSNYGWDYWAVGCFLALWIMGYGVVQTLAPLISCGNLTKKKGRTTMPDGRSALAWALALALIPAVIAMSFHGDWQQSNMLLGGLLVFGFVFAVNSSQHSYLIVSYADADNVALDVGFYYMANAVGRLLGTILSGWVYQSWGLAACLWVSAGLIALTAALSVGLPQNDANTEHQS